MLKKDKKMEFRLEKQYLRWEKMLISGNGCTRQGESTNTTIPQV